MGRRETFIYKRCYEFDHVPQKTLVWVDAHMDFHSDTTSISGFIGGKALYNIRNNFSKIYIVGVRDVEPGEAENLRDNPHVKLIGDTQFIKEQDCHLHIDGDVLDPSINPNVDHPVEYGWTLKRLEQQVRMVDFESSSVSNLEGKILKKVLAIIDRSIWARISAGLFYW